MADSMAKYRDELLRFVRSVYVGDERRIVYGEGAAGAKLMLVGEAPGEQEAMQGRPFVGRAGKNLDVFLAMAGLSRDALYITNAVKFRPTKTSPAGRVSNRPPTKKAQMHRDAGQRAAGRGDRRQTDDRRGARNAGGGEGGSLPRVRALSSGEPALQPKPGACVRARRGRAGANPSRTVRF